MKIGGEISIKIKNVEIKAEASPSPDTRMLNVIIVIKWDI